MNAVERLEAAITKLETLKASQETWRFQKHTDFPYEPGFSVYLAPDDGSPFGSAGDVAFATTPDRAELIVTLHRTIDAQLAILRNVAYAIDRNPADAELLERLNRLDLDLADAILGENPQ